MLLLLPAIDPAEFTMPCTKPECLGAMSNGFTPDPKLWKLLANIAIVVNMTANVKELVYPKNEDDKESQPTWQRSCGIHDAEYRPTVFWSYVLRID